MKRKSNGFRNDNIELVDNHSKPQKSPQWGYHGKEYTDIKTPNPEYLLIQKKVKDIKNNKYLYAIYRAMKEIGKKHSAVIIKMNDKNSSKIEINERNYIIFLSYILGTIQGRFRDTIICKNDYINGEIFKQLQSNADEYIRKAHDCFEKLRIDKNGKKKGEKGRNEDYDNVRPDFVIHQSQKLIEDDKRQKLIIEAKATTVIDEIDFCWDLLKLNYYIQHYHFRNAIYLIVNSKKDIIEILLRHYHNDIQYYCSEKNKLWFFIQNWDGKKMLPVEIYQLNNKLIDNYIEVTARTVYTEDYSQQ